MNRRLLILWTPENTARLVALWAKGLSTAQIGRAMGTTKNSIIGRANRLKLPARPSPIKRGEPKVKQRIALPKDAVGRACPSCGRR